MTEILTAERDKRNELSTKHNRGFNIIGAIDKCLGVTAIGLCITGVGLLSTIVAAPAIIVMEAVSIVWDEEYSLILFEFEMFTRMKEDHREKYQMSLEKNGNIETEANELLRGNKIDVPTWVRVQNRIQNHVQNHV